MLELIITLAIVGLLVWAITTYLPMPELFRKAIYIVAAICVIIYVLNAFGIWHGEWRRTIHHRRNSRRVSTKGIIMKALRIIWIAIVLAVGYGFAHHAFTQTSEPSMWVLAGIVLYAAATIASGAALFTDESK